MAKLTLSVDESAKEPQDVVAEDSIGVTDALDTVTEVHAVVVEVPDVVTEVHVAITEIPSDVNNSGTTAFEGDELKPFMWHVTHLDSGQAKFRNTTTGRVFVGSTAEFTAKLRG
jgi:hypothetical protein